MTSNVEVLESDPDHVKGVLFNLVLLVWRRRTLLGSYRAAIELVRRVGLQHPEGVGVLQVVEVDAVPPDGEVRKAFGEMMLVPAIRHFSVTHEASGFRAASLRAIVSGAHALARPAFAHSVQSSVAAAARWASAQNRALGAPDDAAAIERAVQELRKLHVEKYP
ncbi:MAG TPA: hypothetical protein VGQ57_21360 [Polyangiaceae bacterium]|jgi:hypothetical protein|nr:hypothetical protein [Polyangiaceae bacterium]